MIKYIAPLCAGLLLSGCADQLREISVEPHLTPVGSGLQPTPVYIPPNAPPRPIPISHGSLWQDGAADLFRDSSAKRVGDVITVKISIKDKASLDNSTNRKRESSRDTSLTFDYGLNAGSGQGKGSGTLDAAAKGNTETKGTGAISRSESIDLLVAAVVTDILPNGNLLISGQQEVLVNYDVRELKVAGIVRPHDISPENSISYERIAEIRISYGGRGRVMEVQQPGWGHQIVDRFSPF